MIKKDFKKKPPNLNKNATYNKSEIIMFVYL